MASFSNMLPKLSGSAAEILEAITALTPAATAGEDMHVLLSAVPALLGACGHKKSKDVREKAAALVELITAEDKMPPAATGLLIGHLFAALEPLAKWQTKVAALKTLGAIALYDRVEYQAEIARRMVDIVPLVSELMWDSKKQVKEEAKQALTDCCAAIDNIDVEPFVPALVSAITNPEEVSECVHKLASTTFVQAVHSDALSITVPLLNRGFKERATNIKRKCAVITENLAKLVANPADVAPFMPLLKPALEKSVDEVADKECRERSEAALEVLNRIAKKGETSAVQKTDAELSVLAAAALPKATAETKVALEYAAAVAAALTATSTAAEEEWAAAVVPALISVAGGEAAADKLMLTLKKAMASSMVAGEDAEEPEAEDSAELLCDCKFSLAYGSNILLNSTNLKLRRGQRCGIIASKSAGKTTLLRSIANGQLEGFPPPEELRTVFVETDIAAHQMELNVLDFLVDTLKEYKAKIVTGDADEIETDKEKLGTLLTEMGFNATMQSGLIKQLSGGWKMKLALVRAVVQKADILLMDEPTNHLDVINVQWVVDFLNGPSCENVTSLIVSHDSKFMDNVCTDIIHFEDLKLYAYKGNLSAFVEKKPEIKSYFELGNTKMKFNFPTPGNLPGVRNRNKAIMTMDDVTFTYPGAPSPQLYNVSCKLSMASRVAIVGANGAGKSTMIKLLTGELELNKKKNKDKKDKSVNEMGRVQRHPNLRFAYVAQHAFHHIEQHLDKTPNEYIQWRYSGGEDKEALVKKDNELTPEEEKKMATPFEIQVTDEETGKIKKVKRSIEKIVSRRKEKKEFKYECKFAGCSQDMNMWYTRDFLIKLGWKKPVDALDRRMAAIEGMYQRTLTAKNVEQHLADVGLEAEFATHNRLRDLSGGQKVKVVLAACTWAQPHILILDEPTNYLDRDSLGALANAIIDFEGGVCLITHNKEFADKTTKVTWVVANHRLEVHGDAEWEKYAAEAAELKAEAEAETMIDACGNEVSIKKKHKAVADLTKQEVKKFKKAIKKKIKEGEPLEEHEEEYAYEWDLIVA